MSDDLGVDSLRLNGKHLTAELRPAITSATLVRTVEGASTIELTVNDPERKLVRSRLFAERSTATVDGYLFELVQVRKNGSDLTVVLEDATVADLRRLKGPLAVKGGTTTLDAFARRLVRGAAGVRVVAETGRRNLDTLARGSESDRNEDSWAALTRLADERAWRVFAVKPRTVMFGSDAWLLKRATPIVVREGQFGVDEVNFDADSGKWSVQASFVCDAKRWAAGPGLPVNVVDLGLGSGRWLIKTVTRSLFSAQTTVELVRVQPALPEPKPEPRDDGGSSTAPTATTGGSTVAGPVSASGLSWPLSGRLTSGFGQRGGRLHGGVDLAVPIGTPVRAAADGVVAFAGQASGYGNAIYIEHRSGLFTRYGHLSRIDVRRGQEVDRGQVIARSGNTGNSTGPHLHFEVRPNNRPADPLKYLPTRR